MDLQLINKMIHLVAIGLLILVICTRAFTLFSGTQGNLPNPVARVFFVATQHLAMSLLVVTGILGLYFNHFVIESWFYAKVILFFVLLSSLSKAYRKADTIGLAQRRAGLFLAGVSVVSMIVLALIKPNFG